MSAPFIAPALPHLVVRRIAYFLTGDLPTLLAFASSDSTARRICRLYISDSLHTIIRGRLPPLSSGHVHFDLLWLILHDYLDPTAIKDITFYEQFEGCPGPTSEPGYFAGNATVAERFEFFKRIEEIVQASPWIPNEKKEEVVTGFRDGCRDAAMAILLPLCTQLKSLDAPASRMPLCEAVFRSVMKEHQRRGTDPKQARKKALDAARRDRSNPRARGEEQLPFSDLLFLSTRAAEYGLGPNMSECVHFLGLPSLQRIVLQGLREREVPQHFPGWPSETPRPSAPEIYFQQSSVSKEAVHVFARGLRGPCEIRQWFEAPAECWGGGPHYPAHADWDRVLVGSSGSIETRFDFNGGNPGCEHAWVSCMYWEKIRDWKKFDEEFAFDEMDPEVEELNSNFERY